MENITIRLAAFEDVAQLVALSAQLGYPATEEDIACRLAELIQQPYHAVCVAVLPNGDVAGWMHLYVYRGLLMNPLTMVGGLVVDEACRGQDIGRQLMAHAEMWGRARGCDAVYIKSNVTREDAHAFYEHLGYEKIKTQCVFRLDL